MATEVSPEELFAVISDATSQDPSRVEPSAKRLKDLFQQAGVYDALHVIAATKTLPLPIRIQASLQFKNEALKNWKSRKYDCRSLCIELIADKRGQAPDPSESR